MPLHLLALAALSPSAFLTTSAPTTTTSPTTAAAATPTTLPTGPKYLIEFGWDEPTTAFMRQHLAQMEQTPFDGTVYHVQYRKPEGSMGSFMNDCWGKQAFTDTQLQNAIDDLAHTPFHSFTHNFFRFNVLPGNVDWFDDYAAVFANAEQSARIAYASNSEGILFDDEQYDYPLFNYLQLQAKTHRTWDAYAHQARLRGRQLMQAFQKGWTRGADPAAQPRPMVIMLTFGLSLPFEESQIHKQNPHDVHYALLVPFLQGMLDQAAPTDVLVDGCELAYGDKTPNDLRDDRDAILTQAPTLLDNPQPYRDHVQAAFGLWLDFEWKERPFFTDDLTKNYYTPAQWHDAVKAALRTTDRYVWIYTEKPRWWSPQGPSVDALKTTPR